MCDCVFCKIVDGNIPSMKIFEDEKTLAFMDVAKDVDGHILVIPKKHFNNIFDCEVDTLNSVMQSVQIVSQHLINNCGYDGVNLLNASDESAGQSVQHSHIHIIPRKDHDGINAWPDFEGANNDVEQLYELLKI